MSVALIRHQRTEVFIELRPSLEGRYAKVRIEGAPDGLPRTFLGVLGSRDEAISKVMYWALGWLCTLQEDRHAGHQGKSY